MRIETTDTPTDADRAVILDGLRAYNIAKAGMTSRPIAVLIRDDNDQTVGGLTGRTGGGWLFIEYFWIPESMRGAGMGTQIICQAEKEAVSRGCICAWLDTFSFQALDFYERQGYSAFGVLEEFPAGEWRHFMRKRLDRAAG